MSTIDRVSIPELMDGRSFYIPAYQRGYRWTSEQVKSLLRDLFTYAKGVKHDPINVVDGDYCCLQPVVAREIIDVSEKQSLGVNSNKRAWEIIDGQQRLTTIFILYRYLMQNKRIDDNILFSHYGSREVYHLKYATRPGSENFLEDGLWQTPPQAANNIDFYHMQEALGTIDNWIKTDALQLCQRYHIQPTTATVIDVLWELLNAQKDYVSLYGTVQVLWYELDANKNVIQEFRETNTNQIRLTNAELIKALFLRSLDTQFASQQLQLQRANTWESIENTLQDNTFWAFLNKRGQDLPNRIDMIFKLRYQLECLAVRQNGVAVLECLKECDNNLKKKDFLYNYFNDKFDGKTDADLAKAIDNEWHEIITIFRMLEDWYDDVICYNLIGMLSQFDDSQLASYLYQFNGMTNADSRDNFKSWLKDQLKSKFSSIKYDEDGNLKLKYGDKLVFNLLLMLNVNHLNVQAENCNDISKQGPIYKFPFDVLRDDWDIEHIDSHTTNPLDSDDEKRAWIDVALSDMFTLRDEERNEIMNLRDNDKLKEAIDKIKELSGEDDITEEQKNHISNLTLLDAQTNRSYGNSLFVTKRRIIIERMQSGQYVPVTTSYVFMKLFDKTGTNRTQWGVNDMKSYHEYICEELKNYLPQK